MTTQPAGTARVLARRCHRVSRSAGDVEFVAHVDEPALRPRRADHRVVSSPGTDMAGQRDDVVLGFRFHIAAVGNRRRFPESGGTRHAGQVSYEL
jgi:hypothetical protein